MTSVSRAINGLPGKGENDAAVLPTLVLDLGHRDAADFGGVADMRAAAGLQIDAGDLDEAHAPAAAGRLDRHRAHQFGPLGQLFVADPARGDRMRLGDQSVEPRADRLPVEARSGYVEIEPAVAVADLPAGHRPGNDAAQEVQAGVHAHQPIAPLPVDFGDD